MRRTHWPPLSKEDSPPPPKAGLDPPANFGFKVKPPVVLTAAPFEAPEEFVLKENADTLDVLDSSDFPSDLLSSCVAFRRH